MERKPVESSLIESIGYDAAAQVLEIEFKNASKSGVKVYRYSDVPISAYECLVSSPSIGKRFLSHIKDKFTATKIESEQ